MELSPLSFPDDEFVNYYLTSSPQLGGNYSPVSLDWSPALPSASALATPPPAHVSGTAVAGTRLPSPQDHDDKEDQSAGGQMRWPALDPPLADLYTPASHPFDTGADHRQHSMRMLERRDHGFGYLNLRNGLEYYDNMPFMPAGVTASPSGTSDSSPPPYGISASDPFTHVRNYYSAFPVPVASQSLSHNQMAPPFVASPLMPLALREPEHRIQDLDDMAYISPEKLRLSPSPGPLTTRYSSESIHSDTTHSKSIAGMGNNPFEGDFAPQPLQPRSRKGLPNRARARLRSQSAQASGVAYSSPSSSPLAGPSDRLPASASSSLPSLRRPTTTASNQLSTLAHRANMVNLKPKPGNLSGPPPSERLKKDDFLIKSREAGMTYKEIRRKGKFAEAESTLRGRYRTLTKPRDERVRKPEWEDKDVQLLKKAVRHFCQGKDLLTCKKPWKQISEYIRDEGGSYRFGNTTCRKRWDELVAGHDDAAFD